MDLWESQSSATMPPSRSISDPLPFRVTAKALRSQLDDLLKEKRAQPATKRHGRLDAAIMCTYVRLLEAEGSLP
jgi:hypothetical protein